MKNLLNRKWVFGWSIACLVVYVLLGIVAATTLPIWGALFCFSMAFLSLVVVLLCAEFGVVDKDK